MKTPRAATHFGACQACGSTQKLPLGVLAQHGYEVQWHQFQGVCVGSGHLPYELSAELLPGLIEAAKVRRQRMREAQRDLRKPTTENRVDYTFDRGDRRFAFDEAAHIEVDERVSPSARVAPRYFVVAERDGLSESVPARLTPVSVTDALSLVNYLRSRNAEAITPHIQADDSYIRWQESRLADWKIRPLQEVAEIEQAEVAKKQKARADKQKERDTKQRAKILRDGQRAARLIAKYEKLVPADIRANLASYADRSIHEEFERRNLKPLPSSVSYLLSDKINEATGETTFRYIRNDPWNQVAAANAEREKS